MPKTVNSRPRSSSPPAARSQPRSLVAGSGAEHDQAGSPATDEASDQAAGTVSPSGIRRAIKASGGVGRGILLLDLIITEGSVRFAELEELSGLPKASLHRLLADLAEARMISFDERALTYQAGFRILEMANQVWSRSDLRVLARDQLLVLNALCGETVQIAVHADTHVVVIDHVESSHSVRTSLSVGHQAPVYCSGIGKVMLAWQSSQAQAAIIERISFARFTRHTLTDRQALLADLRRTSERGYAVDDEEHFQGSHCIAAPVVDPAGQAVAGISITAPTFRVERERLLRWREPLVAAAAEISWRLAPHSSPDRSEISAHWPSAH